MHYIFYSRKTYLQYIYFVAWNCKTTATNSDVKNIKKLLVASQFWWQQKKLHFSNLWKDVSGKLNSSSDSLQHTMMIRLTMMMIIIVISNIMHTVWYSTVGFNNHSTHYRLFRRWFYGQMTQPTVSQHQRTMVGQPGQGSIPPGSAH